ncbi:hypothetical protein WMY93_028023 [Mugilogobius chulae]|uniref:AB hydrolase-1 domain-containing protein n=1 Tax=Mugilogobius chulae TaxID=88201 RepID=A0AAW0N3L2_9GOBI
MRSRPRSYACHSHSGFCCLFPFLAFNTHKSLFLVLEKNSGLQVRFADCGGYRFCYSCRGKPGMRPSILMLHSLSAHKDSWLTVVKYLPKHLHILCVDMPGHEGTTRINTDDYSIEGQARRIHQVITNYFKKYKLLKLHLICLSSVCRSRSFKQEAFSPCWDLNGRNIAGVFAAFYPTEICSLTLICPDGYNFTLNIPLIPTTPEEMEDMFKLCSHVRFKIPQQILQGLVDVQEPHNDFYQEVFMEIVGEKSKYALQEHLHLITAPLQVIWGKQDQVVDVSGASVIKEILPGCRMDLLDNCGHSVVMERPSRTAKLILEFIIQQQEARGGHWTGEVILHCEDPSSVLFFLLLSKQLYKWRMEIGVVR